MRRHANPETGSDGSADTEPSMLAADAGRTLASGMTTAANMVEVAALVGDTARATMLPALMGGQALTSSELATIAHISRPTASGHLNQLADARLLAVTASGRNRYYRIASPLVARMLESISAVAAIDMPARYRPRSAHDAATRFARTCYDHLAGVVGVAIADTLAAKRFIAFSCDGGEVTEAGSRFLLAFGADLSEAAAGRRIFCRACLDWSERRFHIGGHVGAEIWRCCHARGWFKRQRESRAVSITSTGHSGLWETFGIEFERADNRWVAAATQIETATG
jgi:DNA-binding transcriptional ArsR family regulator